MRASGLLAVALALAPFADSAASVIQTEKAKLLATDRAELDWFGHSVSLDGNRAIIGANGVDDNGSASGAAYIFERNGEVWAEGAKLLASDGGEWDYFGYTVAIDGDTAVIGAPFNDENGPASGAAYVFKRVGNVWRESAKLLPSDGAAADWFGHGVSISDDTALISAGGADTGEPDTGAAYVFVRSGDVWTEQAKLMASDGENGDRFGGAVSIDRDTAIIGSPHDEDNGFRSGSTYVFERFGNVWRESAKLLPSDGGTRDIFGFKVALSGNTAIVGSLWDDHIGAGRGAAYVFVRSDRIVGERWKEQAKLLPDDDGQEDADFGYAVSIDGDTAVVGALRNDETRLGSAAYLFLRLGSAWSERAKLMPSDGTPVNSFGFAVSIDQGTLIIGAYADDDIERNCGSAYVYPVPFVFADGFEAGDTSAWSSTVQ